MPLIKSSSKGAFAKNVKAEISAGKPPKQAVAIAYSTKRAAGGKDPKGDHHSSHSARRSEHYHSKVASVVKSTDVDRGANKMTKSKPKQKNFLDSKDEEL